MKPSTQTPSTQSQRGVTLVELIIAIVIVATAVAGIIGAFTLTSRGSADPVIARQMAAIAEGMMTEVLSKPFAVHGGQGATRASFDDILDYDDGDTTIQRAITDADGNAVEGLANYRINVVVEGEQNADVVTLDGVPDNDVLRITVTVTETTTNASFSLTGWRTNPS